jgi:glycosyltransferase involved in cell wall biosynthesis
MKTQPKISVLIPTHNYGHFLDETIQSVLEQSFKDFELIVVDNHSTDNTREVVSKYLTDPRVSYHLNKANLGLVGNWNKCLSLPNAEYIKFICADDKIHPHMLDKYYKVMELNPQVSLVTCNKQLFDGQPWRVELPLKHLQNGKKVIFDTLNSSSWIGEPTSVMFRKSNLTLGEFRSDFSFYIDWEMWNRHLTVGDCYIVPETLAYVRAHAAQHTQSVRQHACFEEYYLAKLLMEYDGFSKSDIIQIKEIIKEKAAQCAKKGMYKELPKLYKKANRAVFMKALKITYKERVFLKGFSILWDGLKTKLRKKARKVKFPIHMAMLAKMMHMGDIFITEIQFLH